MQTIEAAPAAKTVDAAPAVAATSPRAGHAGHPALTYRPDVDGLRAVAVVAVVLYHANLRVPGGFVGVDVFFVISGYLITALILKDLAAGTFSLANFWERRIRRIAPALLATTLATALAAWLMLLPSERGLFGQSLAALVACVSNVFFRRNVSYFESAAEEMPLLHTWSLAVEEQFYIVVPILLLVVARLRWLRHVTAMLVVIAIVSFAWSVRQTDRTPAAAFFLLPSRAWELTVGALLACLPWTPRGIWRPLASIVGLGAIVATCFAYKASTTFPGLGAVPPVLGAALFIWAGSGEGARPWLNRFIALRPIVFVGLISYSLYLWHWPIFVLGRYFDVTQPSGVTRLGMVVASVVMAVLSWRFVEQPFRAKTLFRDRRKLFAAAAVAYVGVAVIGGAFWLSRDATGSAPAAYARFVETTKMEPAFRRSVEIADVPDHLIPLGKADADADVRLIVWGDSHAMSVLPPFDALCREYGIAGRGAAHSQTPPALDYVSRGGFSLKDQTSAFNASIVDYVRERKVRAVVLAGFWQSYVGKGDGAELRDGLLKTIDATRAAGAEVYFLMDVPVYDFDVRQALLRRSYRGLDLGAVHQTREQMRQWSRFQTAIAPTLAAHGAHVIDPAPALVDDRPLVYPYDAGGSLYADKHHLSTYGAMKLRATFEPIVRDAAR